jgi:integrase
MAKVAKRRGRYVIDYYDLHGKRRWVTMPKKATLKQSKKKLREIEDGIEKGINLPVNQVPKFKEVAEAWLSQKRENVRDHTLTMYDGHVKNHLCLIHPNKINRITIATVENFISDLRKKGVSLPTIKKILITFGQVMKYAVRHRYVDHNPVSEAERPRDQGQEKEAVFHVLKRDEIGRLIEATEQPIFKMLFYLAVMSGARQGELFALKWSDVLWASNQIQIERTYNHGTFYEPKTKTSKRKIDLGPAVMKALKRWRLACPPNERELVFPGDEKPLQNSHVLKYQFWPALEAAGLPRMRFHDLRHTYASLLIDQGENVVYIQKQLGHSRPTVTLDIYAHLMEKHRPEAAAKLENSVIGSRMVADRAKSTVAVYRNYLK